MTLKCKLRRRAFLYKFAIIVILSLFLSFVLHFLKELFPIFLSQQNSSCISGMEPVDVVYTWVNGSDPVFLKNLNGYLRGKNNTLHASKQRFDDKYELKFSLRSLEKYAPWVNHVYIVTNGQIPYWLNLDYEKVSIVTHEDIFKDSFNLPTFSSPAIESNLHRISDLSKRFIYFNDDIFLGAPIYLEDFYSPNNGFLIYLAWPLPNCAKSCQWMYVADGQCDKDCNNSACQMDGGDCDASEEVKTFYSSTTDTESVNDEKEAEKKFLAETVDKVRTNFYNTFIKKLKSSQNLSEGTSVKLRKLNFLNVSNFHKANLTRVINEHNKWILEKDRIRRKRSRRRRTFNSPNLSQLLQRLQLFSTIDAYSASLQHTNRLLNKKYGFKNRKVPSHAPIMIDKDIMTDLQAIFAKEFEVTERNRLRRFDDIQFSFSYYYFIISETVRESAEKVFQEFDTDYSSTWSDREIRTLLSKLYELPLSYAIVDHFEAMLLNCSEKGGFSGISTPRYERYIDSKLPTISKSLVLNCPSVKNILIQNFGSLPKYKYEIISTSESKYVSFKMLNSNISDVVTNLDEIRSNRRKFICLNDNLDELKESENELVRTILYDFYVSLFPLPSKYELPEDFRNKFSQMKDLNEWKLSRKKLKLFMFALAVFLAGLIIYNVCKKKCCQITNKLFC